MTLAKPTARLEAFGLAPTPASVRLVARPSSWRMTRALLALFIGLGLTPLVALVPPHLPWAVAAFFGGLYTAWRYSRERVTLLSYDGVCPRCDARVHSERACPFAEPFGVHCSRCGTVLILDIVSQPS